MPTPSSASSSASTRSTATTSTPPDATSLPASTRKLHGRRKVSSGKRPRTILVQHKSHVPKVMFLACTARDGKVGLFRCAELVEAGPRAKKRAEGDLYDEDVTITAQRYYDKMVGEVFPALVLRYPNATRIEVQQDGAPVHTQKRKDGTEPMTDRLNAYGATLSPPIEVYTQPPQSPDFNINDLAFFRALSCAVQKRHLYITAV